MEFLYKDEYIVCIVVYPKAITEIPRHPCLKVSVAF